jgi:hypothetical protein
MVRTRLETMLNFAVVVYLVTHGVSVPAEGQGDLVTGFCCAIRAWLEARRVAIDSLLGSFGDLAGA